MSQRTITYFENHAFGDNAQNGPNAANANVHILPGAGSVSIQGVGADNELTHLEGSPFEGVAVVRHIAVSNGTFRITCTADAKCHWTG